MPKNKFRFIMTPNAEQHEAVKAYAEKKGLRIVEAYQELTAHGLKSHEMAGKEPPAAAHDIQVVGCTVQEWSPPVKAAMAQVAEEDPRYRGKGFVPMNPDKAFRASSGLPVGPVPRKGFMPKKGKK